MKLAKANIVLIGAALLALGACDKLGLPGGNTSADAATDPDANKKLDAYVLGNNAFLGTFGFEEKAADYRKSNIAHATTNGYFNVGPGWIDKGIAKLKEGRAISGGDPAMDTAADALIASMSKVQARLESLKTYYDSKKYLDDKLARGKAEDPLALAEIAAAEKDEAAFAKLLDVAIDKRDAAMLDMLKDADPIRYQLKLALIHAKKLVKLFDTPEDAKKPQTLTKGDAEVAIIEKAVADCHQEALKKGKVDPTSLSNLNDVLADYRSFKQSHDTTDLEHMMSAFNSAVEYANNVTVD